MIQGVSFVNAYFNLFLWTSKLTQLIEMTVHWGCIASVTDDELVLCFRSEPQMPPPMSYFSPIPAMAGKTSFILIYYTSENRVQRTIES